MKPILGAQLYTVREHTQSLPDIVETFKKVKGIGYRSVQISAFGPVDAREVAKAVDDSGLKVGVTHMGWVRFKEDLDGVIKDHKLWHCEHTAIGSVPGEYFTSDGVKKFVEELGPIAEKLAKEGLDFSYHNHSVELAHLENGRTWLGTLLDTAKPEHLKAEIDTYWIQAGGGDPAEWIRKCVGRAPVLHLKDMCMAFDRKVRMTEIGEGNLNWPSILEAAEYAGTEYLMVEQDDCYGRDPFECLATSYRNLGQWGYK